MEFLEKILRKITPSREEYLTMGKVASKVLTAAYSVLNELQIDAKPEIHGSYSKDTWLSGEGDIDLFILFPSNIPLSKMREQGLYVAERVAEKLKCCAKHRYASHPYLELHINDVKVDIVPGYYVRTYKEVKTPVDRTRLHTIYVLHNLKKEQRGHVRLLKKFFKALGLYGAEIKVQGFSGYLIELLIIKYGTFINALKSIAEWKPYKVSISLEEAVQPGKFNEPLVFIDPVDPRRNVAAAVSEENLWKAIAAAQAFIENPSECFFNVEHADREEVFELLKNRETFLLALVYYFNRYLPEDVVWGQLKRAERKLKNFLEREGFKIFSTASWYENARAAVFLEASTPTLPPVFERKGPPINAQGVKLFLAKYSKTGAVAGPYIKEGKWHVLLKRKKRDLMEILEENMDKIGVPQELLKAYKGIRLGENLVELFESQEYVDFLYYWLRRKEPWLECVEN
ncbi:MAG: CCA tRNA nucleotidyltransferase [Thermoprotei archaeon]|nr:MAG: CCA tRNA nucleotidyltransferase [Thermoprotei archaeon]